MILFIDTHSTLITIAIKSEDKLYVDTKESNFSHSIYVMPMIESLFDKNNLSISDLTKIVVVNGPGSFTGIRIGLSIAKTIAYALNIEINTISSLTAYLISSDLKGDRMCIITDNKGMYIAAVNDKNEVILDEMYILENKYNYPIVEKSLNIEKILNYSSTFRSENPHFVKANYIKKISVEEQ
ncbi:MAG: tRNA (adenosine(37)-N6)-threonylcarbamoyltransferase complex dimerization subunit type 1 TsaB [Tenericutes bacterium]|nr:tRNA (adenosine(37)-N6)-threonylcarbamoyltransferase complex dimerization subunit type 1 TsaB [Mycoplasmatota bacterium]